MILVFKTNVKTDFQVNILKPYLDTILKESQWNFDLEDCDNILRIDTENYTAKTITKLLKVKDIYCKELE